MFIKHVKSPKLSTSVS
uniref:Uncharacterized protein n=1 Tax=Lepeophtheirus salmonis TaxID=72036 RepID=A0A0K2T9H8_LEPSM